MKIAIPGLALLLAAVLPTAHAQAPPVAPVRPVTDTYFGTQVTDPYRWMEDLDAPEVTAWFRGQADYTNAQLAALPGHAALLARITTLDNAGVSLRDVQTAGGRFFYRKAAPGDVNAKLYVRDRLHGPERLLLDPQALTKGGVHSSIDYYTPSPDGSLVAVGVSPGGSEASTMRLLRSADGTEIGERISRTDYPAVSWDNGHSFFYSRLQKLGPNDSETGKYQKGVAFRHVVGTDPNIDAPVFGYGLSPRVTLALDDVPTIISIHGSPYLFGVLAKGVQNENAVFYAPRKSMQGAETPWRPLADFSDDVVAVNEDGAPTGLAARGEDVYLLTHKDAPRYKIIRVSLKKPDLATASVVVPASAMVIRGFGQAKDGLYVHSLEGGLGRVAHVFFDKQLYTLESPPSPRVVRAWVTDPIVLPFDGSVGVITNPRTEGALLGLTSWTHALGFYAYDPISKSVTDTGLRPPSPVDFSGVTSAEVLAKSADGTMIPLSIVSPKGLTRDGSHPTLLEGYGSYGITITPEFDPTALAWLERGGVLAFAHVRGGGEYGEDWHLAGQKLTKPHTWEDMIACGQYLIDKGYTSPAHMAGSGTSAGGITIGRAITARPDLWGAALIRVGSSNPLRAELTANGPSNIPEFGTTTTPDGFQGLYAMDAYQHVKDGVAYPAVLVTTGINDPRVSSWEPAKMAARLQAATSSGKPVLLRVDYDAGHGIGSTKAQGDADEADEESFLLWQLGDSAFQPAK